MHAMYEATSQGVFNSVNSCVRYTEFLQETNIAFNRLWV
jgi:hypothetical protein